MIIDAWAQHPTRRHLADPMFDSLRRWTRGEATSRAPAGAADQGGDWPLSVTLASMDEAGITRSLVSAWEGPRGPLISNDEVAGFVSDAPERLVGVGSVDISRPRERCARSVAACASSGSGPSACCRGCGNCRQPTRASIPVYSECCELGIPFCTQVGHTGPLMPSEFGRPIPYIDQVAIDFPDLVIVCGHIGYPWTEEMIAVATKHANVYIDTSAYTVRRYPPALVAYLRGHGSGKVLFGTNWPMIAPRKALEGLDELDLPPSARAAFLADNAVRVFGL
jgi:uncharacterized protein